MEVSLRHFKLFIFVFLTTLSIAHSQNRPNMFYAGEFTGFNASAMTFSNSKWQVTLQAPVDDANSEFIYIDSSVSFANKWSRGAGISFGAIETAFWQGANTGINVTNGKHYTFNLSDVDINSDGQLIVQETDNAPIAFAAVNPITPGSSVGLIGVDFDLTVTLAGNKSAQEKVFIRYSKDNFATSDVAEVTFANSTSSSGTATIPGSFNTAGATVNYYAYSTTVAATASSNHDLITLNLENDGGSNYSYSVQNTWQTVPGATNWTTAASWNRGVAPTSGAVIFVGHPLTLDTDATINTIDIFGSGALTSESGQSRTLTINSGGTFANGGTFTANDGTVSFLGTGTISGTTTFNNVAISGGVDFGSGSTINNNLTINNGGYLAQTAGGAGIISETDIPVYGMNATLIFTGNFDVNSLASAWGTSGNKQPSHVQSLNGGNLTLSVNRTTSDVTVGAGSTFTNNSGLTIESDGTVSVVGTLTNNSSITFKSADSGTAQFDELTGTFSGGGTVTAERYISDNRAFRFLASSVETTNFIANNWQQDTHISGSTTGANGFDATSTGNPSMYTFNNAYVDPAPDPVDGPDQSPGYAPIPDTDATNQEIGTPYIMFIRGDRSIDLTDNTSQSETTLSATGTLHTGRFPASGSVPLSAEGDYFSLVANPYQAKVDFDLVTKVDVKADMIVYNPSSKSFETLTANRIIDPGQSVWVQNVASPSAPSVHFEESNKSVSGSNGTTVFSDGQTLIADVELYNSADVRKDVVKFRFNPIFSNSLDDDDFGKMLNEGENVASFTPNMLLSVDRRAIPQNNEIIPLQTTQYLDTQYEFRLVTENWDPAIEVFIQDNYLNTTTPIDGNQAYGFTVDANIPESIAEDRFSLVFDNTTLSVEDNEFGTNFKVYPNPTKDGLFSITTPGLSGGVNLEISNILGQVVQSDRLSVSGNEVNVNAQSLSSGVYLVKLTKKNQNFTSKVIIE